MVDSNMAGFGGYFDALGSFELLATLRVIRARSAIPHSSRFLSNFQREADEQACCDNEHATAS